MELTNRLKQLRTGKGITQEQLANEMGVTAQAVSKWERGTAMPDISLLPELSVYFGVSLDELFGLTEDKEYERIQNMIWDERLLTPDRLAATERRIDEMIASGYKPADCMRLRADMYNHLAHAYNDMAAESAMKALETDPNCKGAHAELNEGLRGYVPDWNARNHFKLIGWYQEFVKKNPEDWRAWMWLLDNLLDDYRLTEAEEAVKGLEKSDNTFRTPLYKAKLAWAKGEREKAHELYFQMEKDFPEDWMAVMEIGEMYAMEEDYGKAVEYLKKARSLQKTPRYADTFEMLAQLYEITGDIPAAIRELEGELECFRTDWGFDSGETADCVRREIERLKKKLK